MKILGVDPGYDRVGIAVIEKLPRGKEVVIYSACLQTSAKDALYRRFAAVGAEMRRVMDLYKPDAMSIENLFMAKNQKTAMRVSEARGLIIYEAILHDIPIFEYTPMEIKMAVTGDGTSDKGRIMKMVGLLVTLPKKKTVDDEYDAIAVALTHSARKK